MLRADPRCLLSLTLLATAALRAQPDSYSFDTAQSFLTQYCQACHQGKSPAGGFALQRVAAHSSLQSDSEKWLKLNLRVRNGEMPPKGAPAPTLDLREQFTHWVDSSLRAEACASGVTAGPAPIRRLNRDEYTATLRDLLDIH